MESILIFLSLFIGLTNLGSIKKDREEARLRKFHVGQTIYRYEDYMNNKGRVIAVISNGEGFCRGQHYRKLRLPFTPFYREEKREGAIDTCTGEVFHDGEWIQHNLE